MVLYIAVGGVLGTLARYYLQAWVQTRTVVFLVGTLAINLIGSLLIAFVIRLSTHSTISSPELRAALTVCFCGAFTTMSTLSCDSIALLRDAEYEYAVLYTGGTILGCLAAVIIGTAVANRLL